MTPIYFGAWPGDDARRGALYDGALVVDQPTTTTLEFCDFTRDLLDEAFAGREPRTAQHDMSADRFAAILADVKPRFIHHERSKHFVRAILDEMGCDLDETYFDVPRLRSSTSDGYLTTGIAYAWHPHRDTWFSAPMCQLNHWLPVYDVDRGNAMAFHVGYFDRAVPNTSDSYNYYVWNAQHRPAAASNVRADNRPLPAPVEEIDLSSSITVITDPGGVLHFSGQQLHSSIPNDTGVTRYSIDFRTVHIGDIERGRSAPNVDVACTGSSIRDFIRASDFAPMPDSVVDRFVDGTESSGQLVFAGSTD